MKYEELLDEGGALFLADNGVVLSYNSIHVKYLTFSTRPPHEKDPVGQQWDRRAREEGVSYGNGILRAGGRQEALLWERDLSQAHPRHQEALLLQRDLILKWALPLFNLDDLLKVIQEQEYAEQTETEGASRFRRKRGILEVDAKISLET